MAYGREDTGTVTVTHSHSDSHRHEQDARDCHGHAVSSRHKRQTRAGTTDSQSRQSQETRNGDVGANRSDAGADNLNQPIT